MGSFTDKQINEVYKDILHTNNSNTGLSTSLKTITCGDGDSTALRLSTNTVACTPAADGTRAFLIEDKDGNDLFTVDSTNDLVKLGIGQHTANTQYKTMGLYDFSPAAGYHYPMVANNMMFSDGGDDIVATNDFGNGTDPATVWDCSAGTPKVVNACLWFILDDIDIDGGTIFVTSDNTQVFNFHLFSYAFSVGLGTLGDLSGGTLVATAESGVTGSVATTIRKENLTVSSASVSSGRVLLGFIEAVSGTDDITVNAQIKYHLR